jgi:rhamnosyltransferase
MSAVSATPGYPCLPELEASRARLLKAIGHPPDLTLLRPLGNLGDQLIWAGTRRLLANHDYREVGFESLANVEGHTALISGGGAWCRVYQMMTQLLPLVEERFERVIVMPSSFDVSVSSVRAALLATRALVFARERESLRQLEGVCRAELAFDCAFYFDYSPYRRPGRGCLNAFRTDVESSGLFALPEGNVDISATCASLDQWLWAVARAACVRTDRAHVMIAAALLGKIVEYRASYYHKVPAIADYCLRGLPVRPLDRRRRPRAGSAAAPAASPSDASGWRERLGRASARAPGESPLAKPPSDPGVAARLTVFLSPGRDSTSSVASLGSLERSLTGPCRLVVGAAGLAPQAESLLAALRERGIEVSSVSFPRPGADDEFADLLPAVATEFVALVGDGAEVFPGTLERLAETLAEQPAVVGCAANLVLPSGRGGLGGGKLELTERVADFTSPDEVDCFAPESPGSSGPRDWISLDCAVVRSEVLRRSPPEWPEAASGVFADIDWSRRTSAMTGGTLWWRADALALAGAVAGAPCCLTPRDLAREDPVAAIQAMASLHARQGLVPRDLFRVFPGLETPASDSQVVAARIFLQLVHERGFAWTSTQWVKGELAPLIQVLRKMLELDRGGHNTAATLALGPPEAPSAGWQAALESALGDERRRGERRRRRALRERDQSWQARLLAAVESARAESQRQNAPSTGRDLAAELAVLERALKGADEQLHAIHSSKMWRAWMIYLRARRTVLLPLSALGTAARRVHAGSPRVLAASRQALARGARRTSTALHRLGHAGARAFGALYLGLAAARLEWLAAHRRGRLDPGSPPLVVGAVTPRERRPRVLWVIPYRPPTAEPAGDAPFVAQARALSAACDLYLLVLIRTASDQARRPFLAPHCRQIVFQSWTPDPTRDRWGLVPRGADQCSAPEARLRLRDLVRSFAIDVVHFDSFDVGDVGRALEGTKVVLNAADLAAFQGQGGSPTAPRPVGLLERSRRRRHQAQICDRVDQIHVRSPENGRLLAPYLRDGWRRIRVVPAPTPVDAGLDLGWPANRSFTRAAYRELLGTQPSERTAAAASAAQGDCLPSDSVDISIVIPTLNGGQVLDRCLAMIGKQATDRRREVICVDSGSSTETLDIIRGHDGVRLLSIDPQTFNHGLTRDLGARQGRGQVLVFINQDAVPVDEHWLHRLTEPLLRPGRFAAIQGGILEVPDPNDRFYWDSCGERFYFTRESTRWIARHHGIGFGTGNAAMRKLVWERLPFGWAPTMEDKKWQKKAAELGLEIGVSQEAAVFHTHNYGLRELAARCVSEGLGWRLLGENYGLGDALRDLLQKHVYLDLARGLRRRRIRTAAELLFPVLRPLLLYHGNHWSPEARL